MPRPKLSVIVIAYNMARELPRTLRSLSPDMQIGIDPEDYEVIVVDNGSTAPLDEPACRRWLPSLVVHRIDTDSPSPVAAINHGLSMAQGDLIGVCIDGARLASPGLLASALRAAKLSDTPVIGTLGFHLGPDVQMKSVQAGYSQAREDALLEEANWTEDGYHLFSISVLAASSAKGWFLPIAESNALFLKREHWQALKGYDLRFQKPGGGLANLDTWRRASELPEAEIILLFGEGTFHQVHGGIATNSPRLMFWEFHDEYVAIRGKAFRPPSAPPLLVGRMPAQALPSVAWSAEQASRQLLTPRDGDGVGAERARSEHHRGRDSDEGPSPPGIRR